MVKRGSLKGTVIKVMLTNGYTLDLDRICESVFEDVPDTTRHSIRSCLWALEKEGYVDNMGGGIFKATREAIDGEVNANLDPSTVRYACGQA